MRWRTIAPIAYHGLRLSSIFDMGFGVGLGPAGAWPFDWTVLPALGDIYRQEVERASLWLVAEYEAGVMNDPSSEPGISKQALAVLRLYEATLALWLPRPTPMSFRVAIHHVERHGQFINYGYQIGRAIIPLERYHRASSSRADLLLARRIFAALTALPHEGPIWVACRSVFGAIHETDHVVRFLLHWIALEAVFGPARRSRGIGTVLSRWAGAFLEVTGQHRRVIAKTLRKSYRDRNAVVHGMRLPLVDPEALILPAEGAARGALDKILSDPALVLAFSGSSRESYLEGLT